MNTSDKSPKSLAIALSGGGHRATLFGLGALMWVVDAGRHRETTSISSVSGGSLTNGFVGQTLNFRHPTTADAFTRDVAGPLAYQITQRGTLFAPWTSKLYVVLLVLLALQVFTPFVFLAAPRWVQIVFALGVFVVLGWVFSFRGRVCASAFRKTLFTRDGKATRLSQLCTDGVDHLVCATELRTAQRVYFSGDFIYGWRFGHGEPGTVELARAVQASAAFPGGFPAARQSTRSINFKVDDPVATPPPPPPPRSLVMTDGGVYDNMGDQWANGFQNRLKAWKGLGEKRTSPDQLLVVNLSRRSPWTSFRGGRIPWLGEFILLRRVNSVMYVNTTNVRRQNIVDSFDPEQHDPERPDLEGPDPEGPLPGALVQIAQSPFVVANHFCESDDMDVRKRANDVIRALGRASGEDKWSKIAEDKWIKIAEDKWCKIAEDNSKVPTTLRKLRPDVSAQLMYHAYVLTMCNLYVIFGPDRGWSLRDIPKLADFERLAEAG